MSNEQTELGRLAAQVDNAEFRKGLPPLEKWNPPFSGDLDMRIARDGSWHYLGTPILRKELVRLFSTILLRQGDEYFLVTPVEKFRIRVDDMPFVAVSVESRQVEGEPLLEFETSVGDRVIADAEHPLRVEHDPSTGEPAPSIQVRANLEARIARSVFYQLVDAAEEVSVDGASQLFVRSAGERFVLGSF